MKQVLTIVLAVIIFDLTLSAANLLGVLLTLIGGIWYASVEYRERKRESLSLVGSPDLGKVSPRQD